MGDYPIEIVDSRSVSLGLGLLVTAAARYIAEGHDYKEVAEYTRTLVPRLRVLFVVDTLEYLHKGGRIGGAQRLMGSVSVDQADACIWKTAESNRWLPSAPRTRPSSP